MRTIQRVRGRHWTLADRLEALRVVLASSQGQAALVGQRGELRRLKNLHEDDLLVAGTALLLLREGYVERAPGGAEDNAVFTPLGAFGLGPVRLCAPGFLLLARAGLPRTAQDRPVPAVRRRSR